MPDVEVTLTTYRNIYTYSQSILWTAYGIALGVSILGVILGVIIYFVNHGSYSSKFSTILRTTRTADITTEFNAEDVMGMDPLPDHINDATISFHNSQCQSPGKEAANVESYTETIVAETPEATQTAEVSKSADATGITGLDGESGSSSDGESRPASWFTGTQRDVMYHEVDH